MTTLAGKTALITGAGSGIGKATALALLREGVSVAACSRNEQRLTTLRFDAGDTESRLMTMPCDVGDESGMLAFTREAVASFGPIDIVIANAGIGILRPFHELQLSEFDAMMQTNVRGVFLTVQHVVPAMIKRGEGDVVIVSSLSGKTGLLGGTGYAASKFAVRGLAQSLMLEVRRHNIRVITVCPGSTDTSFFDDTPVSINREKMLAAEDVSAVIIDALRSQRRALISEIDIRPSDPS